MSMFSCVIKTVQSHLVFVCLCTVLVFWRCKGTAVFETDQMFWWKKCMILLFYWPKSSQVVAHILKRLHNVQKKSVVCAHSDTVMYIRFRGKNRSFWVASHEASEEKCEDVMPDACTIIVNWWMAMRNGNRVVVQHRQHMDCPPSARVFLHERW